MWIVGLPSSPRSLHMQRIKYREIVVAEQLDLHLVWSPSRIFVKPLPRFLLSAQVWQQWLCPNHDLYRSALGFLLSYVALIEREVDFHLAKDLHLIPPEVTWPCWHAFASEILLSSHTAQSLMYELCTPSSSSTSLEAQISVNPRFFYGELRLGRLNWIYRVYLLRPRGYLSGCTTYGTFVRDNVDSLITIFAYATIVLSAMQVGLSTQFLAGNWTFGWASYIFCVFSILAPVATFAAILALLGLLFVGNMLRTLKIRRKRQRQGAGV